MIKKIGRKKIIIIVIFLILGIFSITLGLIIQKHNNSVPSEPEVKPIDPNDLLGDDRIDAQQEVYDVINKIVANIPNLSDFIKNSKIKVFSLKDIKDKFKVDTSEFEKLQYGCSLEYTSIDFSNGINNYTISLSCEAFLLS